MLPTPGTAKAEQPIKTYSPINIITIFLKAVNTLYRKDLHKMTDNITTYKIPRMRTVSEAAKELKEMDENTAVTEYHIRQLALSGVLPRVQAGRKMLINFDLLLEYLQNPTADKFRVHTTAANVNGIRAIY